MFSSILIAIALYISEPYSWDELHATARQDSDKFVDLVYDYYHNFPCPMCRAHLQNMTNTMQDFLPLDKIASKREAQIWGWLAHNSVNLRLQKKWFPLYRMKMSRQRHHDKM